MLDALSDALAREVFSRLAADRPHGRDALDSLPPLVSRALRQRLDREVRQRLDAAAPWVSDAPERWRETALKAARFPAEAWRPAVRETCTHLLSALVDPAQTLSREAVPGDEAPVESVLARFRALGAYPYLPEILGRYAEKKALRVFECDDLLHLAQRIDRRVAAELDVEGWMALLAPLYDLVGDLPEEENQVPGLVLGDVFRARGLPGVGAEVVSHPSLSADALRAILVGALAPRAEPLASAPAPPEVHEVDSAPEDASEPREADEAEIVDESPDPAAAPAAVRPDTENDYLLSLDPVASGDDDPEPESPSDSPETPRPAGDDAPEEEDISGEEPPGEVETPAVSEAEIIAPERGPVAREAEPDDEPLWARLARQRESASGDAAAQTTPGTHAPDPETRESEPDPAPEADEPLWRRFAKGSDAPPTTLRDTIAPPLADEPQAPDEPLALEAPLDEVEAVALGAAAENREWYVEHLFKGDEAAYGRVLGQIARAQTWTEATQIIGREIFRRNKVNIYSEPAVSFTAAVEGQLRG